MHSQIPRIKLLGWQLRAKLQEYKTVVAEARRIIAKAMETARFVVSWSGGKDSTVLTHLVHSIEPETPIIIQFDDCDWPEKMDYVDRVCAAEGWKIHRVCPDFSVWEMAKGMDIGKSDLCAQSHKLTRTAFLDPLDSVRRELGCNGVFMGLRSEESRARRLNFASRGPLYRITDGTWRCSPLLQWIAEDVFAYHVEYNLPINPSYLQNRFLAPEEIRISWAIPTPTGMTRGAMEHLRFYYPEQFRRLRDLGIV